MSAAPRPLSAALLAAPGPRQLDHVHRAVGKMMEGLGLGPRRTPSSVTLRHPLFELRDYGGAGKRALLIVPAPIKAPYVWDMAPERSVVRRCLDAGLRVSMMAWRAPTAEQASSGLADYLAAIGEAAAALPGGPPFLAGHSLGGTLAAVFASLNPERVGGLLLVAAPLSFGTGAFEALLAALPQHEVQAAEDCVAGCELARAAYLAAPGELGAERWLDWWQCLADPEALRSHLQVVRWTLDELPMPRRLYQDVLEAFYRGDRFASGGLRVDGRRAALDAVSAPVLVVAEARSRIVPPESAYPPALSARGVEVLWYHPEPGVCLQHVGPLVGRRAHVELWPRAVGWLQDGHDATGAGGGEG